jgi:hypothetical protein
MKHPNHNIADRYKAYWRTTAKKVPSDIYLTNKCLHTEIIYFADNYHCSECGYKITQWGDL